MKKNIAKKTIILYILKMLEDYPNDKPPITLTNIAKTLNAVGVPCDRKTVGRNVNYLIEFGCPIVRDKGGYCYLKKDENYEPMLKDLKF